MVRDFDLPVIDAWTVAGWRWSLNGLPLKGGCQLAVDTTLVCTALWSRGAINAQMATLLPVGRWRLTIASGLSTLTIQQCRPDVVMGFQCAKIQEKIESSLVGTVPREIAIIGVRLPNSVVVWAL